MGQRQPKKARKAPASATQADTSTAQTEPVEIPNSSPPMKGKRRNRSHRTALGDSQNAAIAEGLESWAASGGGNRIPRGTRTPVVTLRYPTDMFGLRALFKELADIVVACRKWTAISPTEREEHAIEKIKYHGRRHAGVLSVGKLPHGEHLELTMMNAQRLLDALRQDYERVVVDGALECFDDICKEIRATVPELIEGNSATRLAELQEEFRVVLVQSKENEVLPEEVVRAYVAVRRFLSPLRAFAGRISERRQQETEARRERQEVGGDVFASIDRM